MTLQSLLTNRSKQIFKNKMMKTFLIFCCVLEYTFVNSHSPNYDTNIAIETAENFERPIIGILSQEVSPLIKRTYPDKSFESYIASSYVKYIEGSGGRVIPLWIGKPREYYEDVMSKINGVLLPGGATYFNVSNGYADAGKLIYEIAIEQNNRGVYMPIWGTCLGFELLVYLTANMTEVREDCSSSSQALPLEFIEENYMKSRMFKSASNDIIDIFKTLPVTANFHIYCFTKETFSAPSLADSWNILSVNHDWNNFEFVSTIEHKKYPFFGVQFHPEKVLYEFVENRNISHFPEAILASQYLANFFVNEVRQNQNRFTNKTEEKNMLIYNYGATYTGAVGSSFLQQYLFETERSISSRAQASLFLFLLCAVGLRALNLNIQSNI